MRGNERSGEEQFERLDLVQPCACAWEGCLVPGVPRIYEWSPWLNGQRRLILMWRQLMPRFFLYPISFFFFVRRPQPPPFFLRRRLQRRRRRLRPTTLSCNSLQHSHAPSPWQLIDLPSLLNQHFSSFTSNEISSLFFLSLLGCHSEPFGPCGLSCEKSA